MKDRKGITVLELILTLSLISIIIMIGFNFLYFGNKAQSMAIEETERQARTRLISEYFNNIARYSTKAHTIPKSSFQYSENGVRDPYTSYIGITKDGHVVIDEPGENEGDPRRIQYLAKKQEGIDYEIRIEKVKGSDGKVLENTIRFSIYGIKNGKIVDEIVSNVEIMNSMQVEHLGTESDPAVALAFTKVDPENPQWIVVAPEAYVTLVLDKSGSMSSKLERGKTRLAVLKEKSITMINRLAALEFNIYVSVVPFSDDANNPTDFYNVNNPTEKQQLINIINGLRANGQTNTGDGIRRAFYKLKNKVEPIIQNDPDKKISCHLMLLVDGETNRKTSQITRISNSGRIIEKTSAIDTDAPVTKNKVVKVWDLITEKENNNNYVRKLGDEVIKKFKFDNGAQIIKPFVIGFVTQGTSNLQTIGDAINAVKHPQNSNKPYLLAKDADDLDFAFERFTEEISDNLWYLMRPKLWPDE